MCSPWLMRAITLTLLLVIAVVACAAAAERVCLIRVEGRSMHPTLHPGDICVVLRHHAPDVGDIALYRARDHQKLELHRVIGRLRSGYVTKGDANPIRDVDECSRSGMLGTVRAMIPLGGLLERWRPARAGDTLHNQSHTQER